jgi:hypothetical protein
MPGNVRMKMVLVLLPLLAGCGSGGDQDPAPPSTIDYACGPWQAIGLDDPVGAAGMSARQAFAAVTGRHILEGPSPTGNPDDPGMLVVDVSPPAGEVVASSSDAPGASRGSCGVRVSLVARAATPDGALSVGFDAATLWPAATGEMTIALAADVLDPLPEPYQANDPVSMEVSLRFGPAIGVEAHGELRLTLTRDQLWSWSAITP